MRNERVLLFAPHPDDESIGAGGLLQRLARAGAPVKVVYLTDGEHNDLAHRALLKRWRIDDGDRDAYAAMRRGESLDALSTIGIDPAAATFLHLPDTGIADRIRVDRDVLIDQFRSLIGDFAPTLIIAPSFDDLHADHVAAAQLITAAQLVTAAGERDRTQFLGYVVHGDTKRQPVAALHLTAEEQLRKRRAIAAHRSQMVLARDRLLRRAGEYESFYSLTFASSIPSCVRTLRFWCSHLCDLRTIATATSALI
jgi:LmbE family N-acetylglucosaminyl deacetylase